MGGGVVCESSSLSCRAPESPLDRRALRRLATPSSSTAWARVQDGNWALVIPPPGSDEVLHRCRIWHGGVTAVEQITADKHLAAARLARHTLGAHALDTTGAAIGRIWGHRDRDNPSRTPAPTAPAPSPRTPN